MNHFRRTVPPLALCLLLCSCTWNAEDQAEEIIPEEDNGSPNASLTWVTNTTMQKTILRMVEEENGNLEATGSEDAPYLDDQPSEYYETNFDVLIEVGMLAESDDGYTIASDAELGQLPGEPEVRSSLLASAMGSILRSNEVRWCGEGVRGMDFTDNYLDTHSNLDHRTYDTQDEYLESIEDYVNCGTG